MTTSIRNSAVSPVVKALIGEPTVLSVIAVNTVVLFIDAFPDIHESTKGILAWIDYVCMAYFVIEALWKIRIFGLRNYWRSGWNRFDLVVIAAGVPLLLNPPIHGETLGAFALAPLLRMGRFARLIRVMRFVPNVAHIAQGVARALRASVGVFLVLLGLNVFMALGATILFGELPEAKAYFGDPFASLYTLFKVFTVEGWYEIPDELAARGLAPIWVMALRTYFIVAVLVGGILGLSLANAIFVDEMTTDNTDDLEEMVMQLHREVKSFREEMQQVLKSTEQ